MVYASLSFICSTLWPFNYLKVAVKTAASQSSPLFQSWKLQGKPADQNMSTTKNEWDLSVERCKQLEM